MGLGVLEATQALERTSKWLCLAPGKGGCLFSHVREGYPHNLKSKGKFLVCTECKESDGWGIYLEFNRSKIVISDGTTKALANW